MLAGVGAVFAATDTLTPAASQPQTPPSASLQYRAVTNPFDKISEAINELTVLNRASSIVTTVKTLCVKLEISGTDGCPSTLKDFNEVISATKQAIKDGATVEEALSVLKESLSAGVKDLGDIFERDFGGDDRTSAVQPEIKPINLYDAKKFPDRAEHASINPFDSLLEWVDWWDKGSWYIKTIRTNSAPKIINLVKTYCQKFELRGPNGCPDEVKDLKSVIKTGRVQKVSRDTLFSTFKSNLQYLSDQFESEYGSGDSELGGGGVQITGDKELGDGTQTPVGAAASNLFAQKLAELDSWVTNKILPGAIRTKYGPKLIKELAASCSTFDKSSVLPDGSENPDTSSPAGDHCRESVNNSPTNASSLYRLFTKNSANKISRADMISGMKSELEYYSDAYESQQQEQQGEGLDGIDMEDLETIDQE